MVPHEKYWLAVSAPPLKYLAYLSHCAETRYRNWQFQASVGVPVVPGTVCDGGGADRERGRAWLRSDLGGRRGRVIRLRAGMCAIFARRRVRAHRSWWCTSGRIRASGPSPAPSAPHDFRSWGICKRTCGRTRSRSRLLAPSAPVYGQLGLAQPSANPHRGGEALPLRPVLGAVCGKK